MVFEHFRYWFSIENTVFSCLSYHVSVVELFGLVFGLLAVWLAVIERRHTWSIGWISQIAYFAVFYQIQLYSDMFLQVFFSILGIYGFFTWGKTQIKTYKIGYLTTKERQKGIIGIAISIVLWGFLMSKLHVLLPFYFPQAAALPYLDGAIGVLSVFATFYQTRKKIEAWWLYTIVNVVAIGLYYYKNIPFSSVLYAIFGIMGVYGWVEWRNLYKKFGNG